jgi:hypothetical protein
MDIDDFDRIMDKLFPPSEFKPDDIKTVTTDTRGHIVIKRGEGSAIKVADTSDQIKRYKINNFRHLIKDVIFNDPAVIIKWIDGTKTVVKCQKGDKFDPEKGFALAIVKHLMGDIGYYNTIFKDWID